MEKIAVQAGMPADRPSLGVVAISYNEEVDLPGFIDHLLPWVSEIVIVDDGSTDGTAGIAAAAGDKVRFIESPRREGEYFSHQRNKGIDASLSQWLLHMDIDERVSPALAAEILEGIQADGRDGYRFRRLNHFMHRPMRGGGWQSWNLVHLARRDMLRFGGMYHESCDLECPEDRVGQLSGKMYHLNESDFGKRLKKSDTYREETLQALRDAGRSPGYLDLVFRPLLEFARKYVLKMGFRDGIPGLISAIHAATAVFRAQALRWDEQNRIPREQVEEAIRREWRQSGVIE